MHPQEFAEMMIAAGRKGELIEMLTRFSDKLYTQRTNEHSTLYGIVNMFMVSIKGQLLGLKEGQTLDDDKFLSVWKSLGLFGIERQEIERIVERDLGDATADHVK